MDRSNLPTSGEDKPGAPALDSSVKVPKPDPAKEPPSATTVKEKPNDDQPKPAFQPNPTYRGVEAPPVNTTFTANDHKKRTEYLKSVRQSRPKKSHFWRNFFIILIILLVVAAGFYWFVLRTDEAAQQTPKDTKQPNQQSAPTVQPLPDEVDTKSYSASSLPLSLEYPASWTVDEQNGVLTITSPVTQLTAASGNQVPGKIILTVQRPQDANLTAFDEGSVVAVLASERMRYTQPAPAQQGTTYVSFLQYPNTTTKGGLDAIYITGNSGYLYAGVIPKEDLQAVDPLIGLTFISCGNSDCPSSTQEPLAISSDLWQEENFKKPLADMLKSFMITS